jgi:hypothetical protein
MKNYRQKNFFWGIAAGIAADGVFNKMNDANQAERDEDMQRQLKKIEKKAAQNPEVAGQVGSVMQQRGFGVASNALGLVKDLGKFAGQHKKALFVGTASGAAIGLGSYGVDKAIQADQKKLQNRLEGAQQKAAAAGGGMEERQFAATPGMMTQVGTYAKKAGKALWENKGSILGMGAVFGGLSGLGYLGQRKQMTDMIKQTEAQARQPQAQQLNASEIYPSSIMEKEKAFGALSFTKAGWNIFKSHPGQSTLGFLSNFAGGGGTEGVAKAGKAISEIGAKSGNAWTQKVGKFVTDHPKTALAGSIPVGLGVMTATWGTGEKAVKKVAGAVDKNAFAYEKSQAQQVGG